MDINHYVDVRENEKPLDYLVDDGGLSGILRTIACIGDSLSSGEFESKDETGKTLYHDFYEYSWGQFMARHTGSKVYNFSKGGMSAKEYLEDFAPKNNLFDKEFLSQGYIIALGCNDISTCLAGNLEFGSIDDIDTKNPENNKDTFAGYFGKIIQKYKALQPKAKFFLVTMPKTPDDLKEKAYLRDLHQQLMHKLSEIFDNTYVIDLREYAPVYDSEFKKKFYLGNHLNASGYLLTSRMIESYIDYIIRHNYEDFKQIGFVGTPYSN